MPVVRVLVLGGTIGLVSAFWAHTDARADDSFRCGTHLIEVGDSTALVEATCGRPSDVRHVQGHVSNGDGTSMTIDYEVWRYDLGPVMFCRFLVFSGGTLTSITRGDYGG